MACLGLPRCRSRPSPARCAGFADTERPANNDAGPAWIDKDPLVVEARRALAATGHGAAALAAGSYEWTARASAQRRNVRDAGNSNEWSAQLERGVRIGGKAALDRQIGDADIAVARARIGAIYFPSTLTNHT